MNNHHQQDDSNLYVFFIGAIFNVMADPSISGLEDYAIKATIGGIIWLLFKVIADWISQKLKVKQNDN
ncbi:MAG: hypothetical protein M3Q97_11270 [Bacteroidota bacterium]|nr:hypothetical protein [Bacteroidota bacterium]